MKTINILIYNVIIMFVKNTNKAEDIRSTIHVSL